MKVYLMILLCSVGVAALAQEQMGVLQAQPSVVVQPTVVVNQENPRYSLWEGVDVAIKTVIQQGQISKEALLAEINRMAVANEIRLPYEYNYTFTVNGCGSAKKKMRLNAENRRKKAEFENAVIQRADQIYFQMQPQSRKRK